MDLPLQVTVGCLAGCGHGLTSSRTCPPTVCGALSPQFVFGDDKGTGFPAILADGMFWPFLLSQPTRSPYSLFLELSPQLSALQHTPPYPQEGASQAPAPPGQAPVLGPHISCHGYPLLPGVPLPWRAAPGQRLGPLCSAGVVPGPRGCRRKVSSEWANVGVGRAGGSLLSLPSCRRRDQGPEQPGSEQQSLATAPGRHALQREGWGTGWSSGTP